MSAKELFEKIGYKLKKEYSRIRIKYENEEAESDITFWLDDKSFVLDSKEVNLSMELLQAINKQIEELGWNND